MSWGIVFFKNEYKYGFQKSRLDLGDFFIFGLSVFFDLRDVLHKVL